MQNGITRLYKAIWYTQIGRALEHRDLERENTENTHDDFAEEFDKREDDHPGKDRNSLWSKTESLHDFKDNTKPSEKIIQKILINNLYAVRGTYEDIINDKKDNIQRYKQAIGQLIALIESKKSSLKGLTEDIDKLEKMKVGAIAKSKNVSSELKLSGLSDSEIKQHPDYIKHVNTYNDFNSTVNEKKARIDKLEEKIASAQQDIEHHKSNITQLHRDVEKIKTRTI